MGALFFHNRSWGWMRGITSSLHAHLTQPLGWVQHADNTRAAAVGATRCSSLAQVLDLRGVLSCRQGGWLRGCLPGITSGANPLPHGWCQLARNRPQKSPRKCCIVGPVAYYLAAFDYHDLPGKNPDMFWLLQSLLTCPPTAAGTPPTCSGAWCFKYVFAVVYLSTDLSPYLSTDLSMGWIRIKVDTSDLFPSSQHISAVSKMAPFPFDYPPLQRACWQPFFSPASNCGYRR